MKHIVLSLFLLSGAASICSAQDKPAQNQQTEIDRLVDQLGADSYQVREDAQKALQKIGKPALPALRKACESQDLEVASRAQELIEQLTGKRVEEPKPKPDTPSRPAPGPNMDPDAMKEMLDKLEQFGNLSPNLQKTLDALKKMAEGGSPDLGEMGKLFRDLFGRDPVPPQSPTDPAFDRAWGVTVKPVSDALKAHLFITPAPNPQPLQHGLLVERVVQGSHAWKNGLRPNDIIIFISKKPTPTGNPTVPTWKVWRDKGTPIIRRHQLEVINGETHHIEVIRRGRMFTSIQMPALSPPTPKPEKKEEKKGEERGF